MSKIKRFLIALTVLAAASLASAQIGTPPGIGYPPWTSGGTFTGSLAGPVGCTTPPFTFTGDPNTGLCADGADSINLRAGGVSGVNVSTTATTFTGAAATGDKLRVTPYAGGAGTFVGDITSEDLTGARTYTLPDATGEFLLGGAVNSWGGTSVTFGADLTDSVAARNIFSTVSVANAARYFNLRLTDPATDPMFFIQIGDDESGNSVIESRWDPIEPQFYTDIKWDTVAPGGLNKGSRFIQQYDRLRYFRNGTAPIADSNAIEFDLDDQNADDWLSFTGYSGGAASGVSITNRYDLTATTAFDLKTVVDTVGTSTLQQEGDELDFTLTAAVNATPHLELIDAGTNDILTFTEVLPADNSITVTQTVSSPQLWIAVDDGPANYDSFIQQSETVIQARARATAGGYYSRAQVDTNAVTLEVNSVAVDATLELIDDPSAQNFLTFREPVAGLNVITFQQDVAGPGWQVATTDGTTTNTLVQNENNFQVDLAGAQQSDIAFALADAPNGSFLTFTDAAVGAGIIDFSRNIDTYTLITAVDTSAGADARTQVEQTNAAFIAQNTSGTSAAADFTFWLADNAGSYDFLTLADSVGDTGSIIFRGATDADAPNLSFIASHTATPHDATFTLDGDDTPSINMNVDTMAIDIGLTEVEVDQNLAVGDATANDQIRVNPVVAGGAAFDVILTTVDVTGADKTVTFADASGTVMLTTVANNGAGNAGSVTGGTNQIIFEGTTGADNVQTFLQAVDPTVADGTFYVADLGLAGSQNPTATAVTTAYMAGHAVMAVAIPDTGADANPALLTLEPVPGVNVYLITCSDDDTCDVTVDEGSAQPGMEAVFINIGAQTCDFADQAGVLELTAGAALTGGQNNNLSVVYANGAFIETGRASTP